MPICGILSDTGTRKCFDHPRRMTRALEMKKKRLLLTAAMTALLSGCLALTMMACAPGHPDGETTAETSAGQNRGTTEETTVLEETTVYMTEEITTAAETAAETAEETTTADTAEETSAEEETTQPPEETVSLGIKAESLQEIMQNLFTATRSTRETVLFMEKGDVRSLLFPIEAVEAVTSYDGSIVYTEGVDYVVEDGKLRVTENSAIPCITAEVYYNQPDSIISAVNPATGEMTPIIWGEGQMKAWQVSVTYTHSSPWEGYTQESYAEVYKVFLQKLTAGEDVTLIFYGDSITWGANSSFLENLEPKQGSYTILLTEALADLFGYTVRYVDAAAEMEEFGFAAVPAENYVAGERGTITYVNAGIGGWASQNGTQNFKKTVKVLAEKYGCDLFVLAFGMNDGVTTANATKKHAKNMIGALEKICPDVSVLLVSSMTPHTGSSWDHASIGQQEEKLLLLAEECRREGRPCAVACVNSVSKAVQEHKVFSDYTGNNINHPNDWFYRVYAQTLLQALVGYENMD